jgi:hypothetical protein
MRWGIGFRAGDSGGCTHRGVDTELAHFVVEPEVVMMDVLPHAGRLRCDCAGGSSRTTIAPAAAQGARRTAPPCVRGDRAGAAGVHVGWRVARQRTIMVASSDQDSPWNSTVFPQYLQSQVRRHLCCLCALLPESGALARHRLEPSPLQPC